MQTIQSQSLLHKITRRSDLALAVLLVMVIFMMIMPLPTIVIDTLIAFNMSLAIIMLMLAIYLPSPLSFSSFPSVLLLSTLFRLSLSIATTRVILSEGEAGHIIQTFGEFVVAGNMIVGIVVFLIITIVQFIVITKGSERIAEVSARFSLDAMPGKQMSIDSDLRAGVISMADARKRRSNLEKESQLFGSMDGAMKFVKGDAIAGLIIIIVNIIGGIAIGSFQRGMPIGEAMQLYSLLTIGDGLVSQIPALFVSITSGIIVSRVTVDEESNLGEDIGRQLLGQPNALLIGATVVTLMGLIPGFPTIVFFFLGAILGLTGFLLKKVQNRFEFGAAEEVTVIGNQRAELLAGGGSSAEMEALDVMQPLAPVLVELPEAARESISLPELNTNFISVREDFYKDLGVTLEGISISLSKQIEDDTYRISVHGIPVGQGQLGIKKPLLAQTETNTSNQNALPQVLSRGLDKLNPSQILTRHVAYILRRQAPEFIGVQEIHALMGKLEAAGYATLVQEAQRAVNKTRMVDILKRLLGEGISIRDMRQILGTLVEFGETEKDNGVLTERVRVGMKRQLSYTYTNGTGRLPVYLFDPESEKLAQSSVRQTPAGVHLALTPDVNRNLVNNLHRIEESNRQLISEGPRPVILTSLDLRRHLRTHLAAEFPDLPIMSLPELTSNVSVQPVGEIRLTQ
ncbi:FHIPEP family type III secretion protein [uncultured Thiothrix sp.]|uniref:FHIPEP family type III secretion protein n=1 Tax=uncultured Thiothrix sp. TaxID=223185 RepID=UPI00262DA12B|nr:FHIPEP family type III secretion protein [uncultured Thiothrix sp.]HMT92183.1 FHIPEP family type III secretion protein [Thiolinea sp.]